MNTLEALNQRTPAMNNGRVGGFNVYRVAHLTTAGRSVMWVARNGKQLPESVVKAASLEGALDRMSKLLAAKYFV